MIEEAVKCIRCGLTCALTDDIYCVHHGGATIVCHKRVDLFREEIDRLKKQNRKMRESINKCLDHWAIVAGPSAYEKSVMRVLLEKALGGES